MFSRHYLTPSGSRYRLFSDMANNPHLLIAGATGSGKSVVINGIITNLLYNAPCETGFILIDPKRVELSAYRHCPHTLQYASEPRDMIDALRYALQITEDRYKAMARQQVKKYSGGDVYVIIDELADLMTTQKKAVLPLLQRLCQIGRAARIHVIAATQCPLATIIPTAVKCNFDTRVALRTRSSQDSRNILGITGCELLPRYGQAYYMVPEGTTLYNIPMYPETETARLIDWWTTRKCIA